MLVWRTYESLLADYDSRRYDVRKSPVRGLVGLPLTPLFSIAISEFWGLTTCVILQIPASFLVFLLRVAVLHPGADCQGVAT